MCTLLCLCAQKGALVTTQPIFSSCSVVRYGSQLSCDDVSRSKKTAIVDLSIECSLYVYCGSHDKHLYCWNGATLEVTWKTELESEIYSIPFCTEIKLQTENTKHSECSLSTVLPVVCVCSSNGVAHLLHLLSGKIIANFRFPGDVFSSPVISNNCIIVGCRDDFVYCVQVDIILK